MNASASPQSTMISTVITLLVVAIVLFFRLRNVNRERPLKLGQLWIVPGIYALIAGVLFYNLPPKGIAWLWCGLALAVGGALGWQRGRTMHISVNPETQTLMQKTSLASMFFLLGLVAVRTVARVEGQAWHFDVMLLTDLLVSLALGLLTMQRVEMYLRAKKLLEAARGA